MKRAVPVPAVMVFFVLVVFLYTPAAHALTAEEFYSDAKKTSGINAFAATCQSAHETGFWTSSVWKRAYNGAGIKADKVWRRQGRPTIQNPSHEIVGGRRVQTVAYFRAYSSLDDFLADYRVKIAQNYPLSVKHADNVWGFFAGLLKGRYGPWASTGKYFEYMTDKAFRLAPSLYGEGWKDELHKDFNEAKKRGVLGKKEIQIVEKALRKAGLSP